MMTLTRYGLREWGGALLVFVAVSALFFLCRNWAAQASWRLWTGWTVTALAFLFFVFVAFFFRNPDRTVPEDGSLLVSAADGVVKDIEVIEDFNMPPFQGKALRVGIFLSVLNVHLNRAPADFEITDIQYRPGRYLDARDERAGKENEAMTVSGTGTLKNGSFPLAVRQISGAIARRIVCPVQAGTRLKRGQIYGMIKFGSRTEIYLPAEGFELFVKVGDTVRGGTTIIARQKPEK